MPRLSPLARPVYTHLAALAIGAVAVHALVVWRGAPLAMPRSAVAPATQAAVIPPNAVVLSKDLDALLPSPEDIPVDVVPQQVNDREGYPWDHRSSISYSAAISVRPHGLAAHIRSITWWGPPVGEYGAKYTISATISLAGLPEGALEQARQSATGAEELSGALPFADGAWGWAHRLAFVRRNAVVNLASDGPHPVPREDLQRVAERIGARIDAALRGTPLPVAAHPVTAEEMGMSPKAAWTLRAVGAGLWGQDATTIVLARPNALPRLLPAKRVGTDDALVPISHLAALINGYGGTTVVKTKDDQAITLAGRTVTLRPGDTAITTGSHTQHLATAPEEKNGQLLVPLSLLRHVLGWTMTWEDGAPPRVKVVEME